VGITEILELEFGSNVAKRHYLWRAIFEHEVILMTAARLYVEEAFSFYKQFIREYSQNKAAIYARYGFNLQGSVGSKDWEVFAAILLGDRARPGNGADLLNHEVKSAVTGNSFEYQYHRHQGLEKLAADQTIDHIFIARNETYTDIEVWRVDREYLAPIFDRWRPELQANYQTDSRQRFRKSIGYGVIRQQGQRLMMIVGGELSDSAASHVPVD
jgi:hypothetical protein